jgi:hypothetical protein
LDDGERRDRRKTTVVQKFAIGLDLGILTALGGLFFWAGQQSERIQKQDERQLAQGQTLEQLQNATAQVSGQVLQMATTTNVSALEARTQVLEVKQSTNESLLRDLKSDMVDRLRRIENKIDKVAQE